MSKWRSDANGKRVLTRSGAMAVIALAAAGAPIVDELRSHVNQHVRRAAWLHQGSPIPESTEGKVSLFKDLLPNHFDRVSHRKGVEEAKAKRNAEEIAKAEEHNEKASILRAAEPEKFDVLAAWLPIVQREMRKLPAGSPQDEYNRLAALCAEVDGWLRERSPVHVPERFIPIAADDFGAWCEVVGCTLDGHAALFLSDHEVVAAIRAS